MDKLGHRDDLFSQDWATKFFNGLLAEIFICRMSLEEIEQFRMVIEKDEKMVQVGVTKE